MRTEILKTSCLEILPRPRQNPTKSFTRMSTELSIIREEINIKINDDLPFRLQTKEHFPEHHFFSQTSLSL